MNKLFLILLIIASYINSAQGRWATHDEAAIEIEFYNTNITINKDGTYEIIAETQEKILKESARNYAVNYRLHYNSDSSNLIILEAKTIDEQGNEFKVTEQMIEDKPLASPGQGFDQNNQILVSFPNITIGSKIYLKYKQKVTKVPLTNFFSTSLWWGVGGYWQASQVTINSKLPLYIKVNDPEQSLKITKDRVNPFYHATITLKKPLYSKTTNEPRAGVLNPKHLTWVSISSSNKWETLAKEFSKSYDKKIDQALPPLFENIKKLAIKEAIDTDIINIVTSQLNEKIKYMGDWRTIAGKFIPRDLAKIASTQVGDCKDFTASTAAILRKIGFKADPVLVMRGATALAYDALPGVGAFNHAMLRVTSKSNKIYWIDPTNIVSMAGGLFSDIANKMVLVLNALHPVYEKIPNIDPKRAKFIKNETITIKDNSTIYKSGTLVFQQERAADYTGLGLYYSNKEIEDIAFRKISGVNLTADNKKSITLPDLKSRIVKDLTFTYAYEQNNFFYKTNLSAAYDLSFAWLSECIASIPEQVTDLKIGPPETLITRIYIKNVNAKNIKNLNYKITSPWLTYTRSIYPKEDGIQVEHKVSFLQNFISKEELETTEYKKLKDGLEKNVEKVLIVFH